MSEHKAEWEKGLASKGVSCSCGFLPKRHKILKNHVERHDPEGFREWREELWKSVGVDVSRGIPMSQEDKVGTKVDHNARRWAVVGIGFKGEVWWMNNGFTNDEAMCGLYTKAKAKELLDWLTSPEGTTSRLESYGYDIKRVR